MTHDPSLDNEMYYEAGYSSQCPTEQSEWLDHIVMRERREFCDRFTEIIAYQLHYFDRIEAVDLATCKATDIVEITNGAIERYRIDPVFHAKVESIVAQLMQALDA